MPTHNADQTDLIGSSQESYYNCERLFDPVQKTSSNYICVDDYEVFQVRIMQTDTNYKGTFGAVLYLDGHRIPGKKVFRKVTVFPGFKRGRDKVNVFRFKVPKPQPGSTLMYPSPFTNAY